MKNANLSKMFKGNYNKKYALLMCNDLKGCNEDVKRLEKILTEYDFNIHIKVFCYPKIEIKYFIKNINPLENDLVYIHYSGHGEKRGKMYKNKPELVSSWLNPNNTVVLSSEIDSLLSNINSSVILSTEACHSETFGKYYQGTYPFIFIGTSEINRISRTFSLNGEPLHGALVHLFEYLLSNNLEITLKNIENIGKNYFMENKIENKLIIKKIN